MKLETTEYYWNHLMKKKTQMNFLASTILQGIKKKEKKINKRD